MTHQNLRLEKCWKVLETVLSHLNTRKQNNSDEQLMRDFLYSRKPAFDCMQIFSHVVHFLQDANGSLI